LAQECVGGGELQQRKAKIQNINDDISSSLKKHVYENYLEFIETAKEISRKSNEKE
jgi:exocyst complex component 8